MILGEFYLVLLEKLRRELPEIKHVDWWNSQPEFEDEDLPFNRPAVFIEFPDPEILKLGKRRELWKQTFILHIVNDIITEARKSKSDRIRNHTLRHLELCDKIHYVLEGYTGIDQQCRFSSIQHTGTTVSHQFDNLIMHDLTFLVVFNNNAAMRRRDPVRPALVVTANILIGGGDYNVDYNRDFSTI